MGMIVLTQGKLSGVYLIKCDSDEEVFNAALLSEKLGVNFVQENEVLSRKNVLRGMGYQKKYPQGKLLRVIYGKIFDVVVDMRRDSKTYGMWEGNYIDSFSQIWIPPGFAHGYLAIKETLLVFKCTEYFHPEDEYGFLWNDPQIAIEWPLREKEKLIISSKDRSFENWNCTKGD